MGEGLKEGGGRDNFAVGEEIGSNSVVARFGDQRPRIEGTLVEVPPVEDWIMVLRFVERCAEAIDNRVYYLLGDSHCGSGSSERTSPHKIWIVLLAVRCQSAKWHVAVGFVRLTVGAHEKGGGRWWQIHRKNCSDLNYKFSRGTALHPQRVIVSGKRGLPEEARERLDRAGEFSRLGRLASARSETECEMDRLNFSRYSSHMYSEMG